jgi:hypothetical protein
MLVEQWKLTLLNCDRGELQGCEDVLALQVRVVVENLLERTARSQLAEDGSDRDAGVADAQQSTHPAGSRLIRSYTTGRRYTSAPSIRPLVGTNTPGGSGESP